MKKNVLFFVLVIGLVFSVFGQNVSDFEYTTDSRGITITGYTGNVKDVRIPDRLNNLPVVAIGEYAFSSNQLTSVTIPNSVTHIGYAAFAGNQLTSVTIPNSVTHIGVVAFLFNQLTSITLPDNVDLQSSSFYASVYAEYVRNGKRRATFNISLSTFNFFEIAILNNSVVEIVKYFGSNKDVIIPDRINNLPVVAIGGFAFGEERQQLNIILPNELTHIGDGAFGCKQLTHITLPNTLIHIGNDAFFENELTNIILPNSLTYIGKDAFAYNQLTSVIVPSSVIELHPNAFDDNVVITRR